MTLLQLVLISSMPEMIVSLEQMSTILIEAGDIWRGNFTVAITIYQRKQLLTSSDQKAFYLSCVRGGVTWAEYSTD